MLTLRNSPAQPEIGGPYSTTARALDSKCHNKTQTRDSAAGSRVPGTRHGKRHVFLPFSTTESHVIQSRYNASCHVVLSPGHVSSQGNFIPILRAQRRSLGEGPGQGTLPQTPTRARSTPQTGSMYSPKHYKGHFKARLDFRPRDPHFLTGSRLCII